MTITTFASGTQATSIGTEHFLSSPNETGIFQLVLDFINFVSGDYCEIRNYQMVLSGGTARVIDVQAVYDAQITDSVIWRSEEIKNDLAETNGCRFSIKQTLGTSRNIPWKVTKDNDAPVLKKNIALSNFEFLMIDSSDHVSPKTGLTITAQRSIDGGAFAACTNSASEVSNGVYKINLSASDLNGDVITLKFTATGADQTTLHILTQP